MLRPIQILACYLFTTLALSASNPPPGIPIPSETRTILEAGTAELGAAIEDLKEKSVSNPKVRELLPDVIIYYNAVHHALVHDQFYREKDPSDFQIAAEFLRKGMERAASLKMGKAPWTRQTGLIVRGYVSDIDDSVQPYGLEIPEDYDFASKKPGRLDIWYHGRNNQLSELRFLHDRETKPGKFHSDGAIVLHPFGRYCNANKFAGETDTFEALESAKVDYPIDPKRITVRGFSMGGAVVWHMAAHHAGLWAAAAPGAGFAETAEYQNAFAKDPKPTWYEQKMWNLYDATVYAGNLRYVPIIAYSGENDKQMQAADIMARFMKKEGLDLPHVIGPGMGHKYHPDSKKEIEAFVTKAAKQGVHPAPREVHLTTYTLRYNEMLWATINEMGEHWKRADLKVKIDARDLVTVSVTNVTSFTLDIPANPFLEGTASPTVVINGSRLLGAPTAAEGDWNATFEFTAGRWMAVAARTAKKGLLKKHRLQGPIDDAFMDSFIFVEPSGNAATPEIERWTKAELKDAIYQWKTQFRGEPRVVLDHRIRESDIRESNLILFGDPQSNRLLARYIGRLPLQWSSSQIKIGNKVFPADKAVPTLIFPNPDNPDKYIVINSGFTFSRNGSQSNSTQVPKLGDWAVLDMSFPASKRIPAGVIDTDFFDEAWQFKISPENPNQ